MARLLFHLAISTDDPPRTGEALAAAWQSQAAGHEVGLWLVFEGVRLGVRGVAETLREDLPKPAAELLDELAGKGARFHVESGAFARREFEPDALRTGSRLAEASHLGTLLDEGWTLVPT